VNVVVCPGVTIGKGSVVGANAAVTRDVAPYTVVAGAPARKISNRMEWGPPARIDFCSAEDRAYVVSGMPVRQPGRVVAGAIRVDEPLRAFVLPGSNIVRFAYRSASSVDVRFREKSLNLAPGNGVLEFSLHDVDMPYACVTLQGMPTSARDAVELHVARIKYS
jgi:hypothetical protein